MRNSVLIIYTGGTIGMKIDPITNALSPFDLEQLLLEAPELSKFNIDISTYTFDPIVDSSDMQPSSWVKLAKLIQENYSSYDGFVVLHGTDTMTYSASALSFLLRNLNKPVIFTGSQIPIGEIRTDGRENLITAIEIAGSKIGDRSIVPEVAIYFHNKLLRGNRTVKLSSENLDAFASFNYPPLAEVGIEINYNMQYIKKTEAFSAPLSIATELCSEIVVIRLFPGMSIDVLRSLLNIKNIKGAVFCSFGAGNAPTNPEFLCELKSAIDRGMTILNVSQCMDGAVNMSLYSAGASLNEVGVISGLDMTTEAAVCKLMYLLNRDLTKRDLKMYLTNSIRGELTKS